MTPEEIRRKTITTLKRKFISTNEQLPLLSDEKAVPMKSIDEICRRAIASILSEQAAQGILAEQDIRELIEKNIAVFGIEGDFLPKEKKVLDGTCTTQEAIEITWNFEAYSALLWALGYTKNLLEKTSEKYYEKCIMVMGKARDLQDFAAKSTLRSRTEILEGLDTLYMCHWACIEKEMNPKIKTGGFDAGTVSERRKALEWILSEEVDWDRISLDT